MKACDDPLETGHQLGVLNETHPVTLWKPEDPTVTGKAKRQLEFWFEHANCC